MRRIMLRIISNSKHPSILRKFKVWCVTNLSSFVFRFEDYLMHFMNVGKMKHRFLWSFFLILAGIWRVIYLSGLVLYYNKILNMRGKNQEYI